MSRRRYLSTDTSIDSRFNRLAAADEFAATVYLMMIPHAADDATIKGDTEELMALVCPMRRDKTLEQFADALRAIATSGLISWSKSGVVFPSQSFYRYQTYIKPENRAAEEQRKTPENAGEHCKPDVMTPIESNSAERRKTPENAASSSLTISFPVSSSISDPFPALSSESAAPRRAPRTPQTIRTMETSELETLEAEFPDFDVGAELENCRNISTWEKTYVSEYGALRNRLRLKRDDAAAKLAREHPAEAWRY